MVAEIYKTNRYAKPIVRIVRRGSSRRFSDKRYDLAEWYLRLTDGPVIVTQYHHDDDLIPSPPTKLEARMPKPNEILKLAEGSLRCTAMIPRGEVHINLMRLWQGGKFTYAKIGGCPT
ncbi:MAG: hypothetical protein FWD61_07440 [Phycisphaerales bacterium]|nr:hypothetical protein [Phycisphaerales bacterium]